MGEVHRLAIFSQSGFAALHDLSLAEGFTGSGFCLSDSQLGWWHIGLGVFNVGAAYIHNRDVLSVAGPFMRRLMLLSGETVNVAIRNGNEAVLIGQLECKSMVRMCAPLGSRLPLHASGAGKALLYPLAEEELMSIILQTGLQQFTPTTLCGYAHLAEGPGTSA
ncbi:Negative regulator of allantoin and glyoxylate utilization operons [Escherichia coli]|nr:Negative regulator of allantoin and glyoxylate utilization operons [Escherichia coli]